MCALKSVEAKNCPLRSIDREAPILIMSLKNSVRSSNNRLLSALAGLPREEPAILALAAQQLLITETIRKFGGEVDFAFIGDSITQNFQWTPSWQRLFGSYRSLNLGLGGDRARNLLWRLEQGLLRDLKVGKIVLLVGINDCWRNPKPEGLASEIEFCLKVIKSNCPNSQILTYGVFPVGENLRSYQDVIAKTNLCLSKKVQRQSGVFRDIGPKFLNRNGISRESFFSDGCHLTQSGYDLWEEDLRKALLA